MTVRNVGEYNETRLGIDPGKNFRFGELEQNANYTKWIRVSVSDRSRVKVSTEGNISGLLVIKKDEFYVENDTRIPVTLFPQEEGYYEGKISLVVWRPKNRLGAIYLDARERIEKVS